MKKTELTVKESMTVQDTQNSGLDDSPCSRVVAASRLEDLAEDLERWAHARIEEQKVAIKQYRQKRYHRDNYCCACGQLDAANRIRDLIRNESFNENKP